MIKVGSRVKFISDTGTGIVRSIKENIAHVEVEDGFEIPALLSDIMELELEQENAAIVKIGPSDPKPSSSRSEERDPNAPKRHRATVRGGLNNYGKVSLLDDYEDDTPIDLSKFRKAYTAQTVESNVDRTPAPVVIEKAPWEVTDYLVKLLFTPVAGSDKVAEASDLEAWLVNDSSYTLFYNVAQRDQRSGKFVRTIESGTLDADSKQKLKTYRRAELAEVSVLNISLLPYKPTSFVPRTVESFNIELHPLKFVRASSFTENDYFDAPSLELILATSKEISLSATNAKPAPEKAAKPVNSVKSTTPSKKSTSDEVVVDLHVEEIIDSTEGMTPAEILQTQLARFTVALDGVLKGSEMPKRVVFIHGVGKGKLRYEIEKLLKRNYTKLKYQDASFAEYGYGAVMVFLK